MDEKYFKTLGVRPDATYEEIRRSYLNLLDRWNPSQFAAGSPQRLEAQAMVSKIEEAHTRLRHLFHIAHSPVVSPTTKLSRAKVDAIARKDTNCCHHRNRKATWICTCCGALFCDDCLNKERGAAMTGVLYNLGECRKCSGVCRGLEVYLSELETLDFIKTRERRSLAANIFIILTYTVPLLYRILFVGMESYPFFSFLVFCIGLHLHRTTKIDFDPELLRFLAPLFVCNMFLYQIHTTFGPAMLASNFIAANLLLTPLAMAILLLVVRFCSHLLDMIASLKAISTATVSYDRNGLYHTILLAMTISGIAFSVPGLHLYYEALIRFNRALADTAISVLGNLV